MTVVLTWPCVYRETTPVTQSVTVLHLCLRHNPTYTPCLWMPAWSSLFGIALGLRYIVLSDTTGQDISVLQAGKAMVDYQHLLSASSQSRKGKQHTPREAPRRHSFS